MKPFFHSFCPLIMLISCMLGTASAQTHIPAPMKAQKTDDAVEPPGILRWVGCGITRKAFMTALAKAYEEKYGIPIQVEGGGATRGIRDVLAGKADLGGSCRSPLPANALEAAISMYPIAWDALVVVVHPDNPLDNITLQQLHDVYAGKLKYWNELDDGMPHEKIRLYIRRGKISGVGYTLRQKLFADTSVDFPSEHVFKSSGPLEQALEQDPWALAVSGISSVRKRELKIVSLNGLQPTYENIQSGQYLMYRPLYLTYNPTLPSYREVRKFILFAHGREGRRIVRENGVVPYLDAIDLLHIQTTERQALLEKIQQ